MFDLQRRRTDFCVAQKVKNERALEIADPNTLGQALLHQLFHSRPRLLDRGIALNDVFAVVSEAGWVAVGRIDVFERDGEVHDVQVEVVDAPVLQLLFADGRYAVVVVEGVPEFGNEEEVAALDETVFYGAGDALAGFDFVAVVWNLVVLVNWGDSEVDEGKSVGYRMRRRIDGSRS